MSRTLERWALLPVVALLAMLGLPALAHAAELPEEDITWATYTPDVQVGDVVTLAASSWNSTRQLSAGDTLTFHLPEGFDYSQTVFPDRPLQNNSPSGWDASVTASHDAGTVTLMFNESRTDNAATATLINDIVIHAIAADPGVYPVGDWSVTVREREGVAPAPVLPDPEWRIAYRIAHDSGCFGPNDPDPVDPDPVPLAFGRAANPIASPRALQPECVQVATFAPESATAGDAVSDVAVVTGDAPAGAYLLFDVYEWEEQEQRPDVAHHVGTERVPVTGAGEFTSPAFAFLAPGTYQWFATLYDADRVAIAEEVWGAETERTVVTVEVTPVAPTLTPSEQCGVEDSFDVPDAEGVTYTVVPSDGGVTVAAEPLEGYHFPQGTQAEWHVEIPEPSPCPVIPPEPVVPPEPEEPASTPPAPSATLAQTGGDSAPAFVGTALALVFLVSGALLVRTRKETASS